MIATVRAVKLSPIPQFCVSDERRFVLMTWRFIAATNSFWTCLSHSPPRFIIPIASIHSWVLFLGMPSILLGTAPPGSLSTHLIVNTLTETLPPQMPIPPTKLAFKLRFLKVFQIWLIFWAILRCQSKKEISKQTKIKGVSTHLCFGFEILTYLFKLWDLRWLKNDAFATRLEFGVWWRGGKGLETRFNQRFRISLWSFSLPTWTTMCHYTIDFGSAHSHPTTNTIKNRQFHSVCFRNKRYTTKTLKILGYEV